MRQRRSPAARGAHVSEALNSEARAQNLHAWQNRGVPNQLIVCMLSESWYGGYQLATVWRAVGHGGYQVSSVGNVRVGVHGGGASKELEYHSDLHDRRKNIIFKNVKAVTADVPFFH